MTQPVSTSVEPMHTLLSQPYKGVFSLNLAPTLSELLQALMEHCLSSSLSQLQSVRAMAMTNCLYLLKYAQEPPHGKVCSLYPAVLAVETSSDKLHSWL